MTAIQQAETKSKYESLKSFFRTGSTLSIEYRIDALLSLEKAIKDNEEDLYLAFQKDYHKSRFDAFANEVGLVYTEIRHAIRDIRNWSKPRRVPTNILNVPATSMIYNDPYGVCLIIGPWNYPFLLTIGPLIPCIAAGNCALIKPSELTIHVSAIVGKIIDSAFEKNHVTWTQGGVHETTNLLDLRWDKIFFTGSVQVGKIVYQAAAKYLTPVTLELGGKSPAIIHRDCNMEMTVKRVVWSKMLNSGQTCVAPDYLLVDESIKSELVDKLMKEIIQSRFAFANGNYVQIINDKNFNRLSSMLDPSKVVFGGETDSETRYIGPTIMDNVSLDDKVMQEEIFGPILPIMSYSSIEEALEIVKKFEKPLSLYLYAKSKQVQQQVLNQLSFGGGAVNDSVMHLTNPSLPFGGVGHSGIGSYHGKWGFETFSHQKSVFIKPTWFEIPLKFSPYTPLKERILRWLLG